MQISGAEIMASSAILNFTDPYSYQAAVRGAQLEFLPTEKGDFRAELTKVTFKSLWMQRGKESLARVFRGAVAPDRSVIGLLTDLDQPEYRHCGAEVSPGAIIVDDHNEMYRKTKAACRWGAMSLKQTLSPPPAPPRPNHPRAHHQARQRIFTHALRTSCPGHSIAAGGMAEAQLRGLARSRCSAPAP